MADTNENVVRRQAETIALLTTTGTGGLIPGQMGEVVGTTEAPLATLVFKRASNNTFGYVKSSDIFTAADTTAMIALTAPLKGDVCKLTSGVTYQLNSDSPSTLADWVKIGGGDSVALPAGYIAYGTGAGITGSDGLSFNPLNNILSVSGNIAPAGMQIRLWGDPNYTHGGMDFTVDSNKYGEIAFPDPAAVMGSVRLRYDSGFLSVYTDSGKGINIPTGCTFNIGGVPHTHALPSILATGTGWIPYGISGVSGHTASGSLAYLAASGLNIESGSSGANLTLTHGSNFVNLAVSTGVAGLTINAGKYLVNGIQHVHENGIVYTGFDNPDNVSSSYNSATRQITLMGTGRFYYQGVLIFDLSAGDYVSTARPVGNGLWYHYYNGTTYAWTTTPWLFFHGMLGQVYKSTIAEFGIVETHGVMPWETHRRLHETLGTSAVVMPISSGLVFNSTTAADRRPAYTSATLRDEDITVVIDATPANNFTKFHVGAGNTSVFTDSSSDMVELNTNVPRVNNPATGAWTDLSTNQYMNIFVMDVPTMSDTGSKVYRKWFINGQLASATRATIDGQLPSSLVLADISLASQEFVFTKRILIRFAAGNWTVISETDILGTKVSQITTPSLGAVALPSLVTGGLGLIPVGTTASGHTVYDGSTSAQLSFDSTYGLLSYNSAPECFTAFKPIWTAGIGVSQVGMGFSMYNAAHSTKFNYAGVYGEIVDNTTSSEDGALVFKSAVAGVLTEQARFVGGEFQMTTDTLASQRTILSNTNVTGSTGYHAASDAGILQLTKYGTTASSTTMGINRASSTRLTSTGGIMVVGTTDATDFVIGTNNVERMRISSNGEIGIGVAPTYDLHLEKGSTSTVEIASKNTTSGVTASAALSARAVGSVVQIEAYSSGYTAVGGSKPNGAMIYATGAAGLSITANSGAGDIRFYTGGNADANLRATISAAGFVGIGAAPTTTAYLTLPTSTAGVASVNIGAVGTTVTSPIDGDIWKVGADALGIKMAANARIFSFRESTETLSGQKTFSNASPTTFSVCTRGIALTGAFVGTAVGDFGYSTALQQYAGWKIGTAPLVCSTNTMYVTAAVVSTTSETTLLSGTKIGAATWGLLAPKVGNKVRLTASGSVAYSSSQTLTIKFKQSTNILLTITTPSATLATSSWDFEGTMTVTTTTTAAIMGRLTIVTTAGTPVVYLVTTAGVTISNAAVAIDLTCTHSVSNAGNTMSCHQASLEQIS